MSATVTLEPRGSGDLPLLERLMSDPRMTEHLGAPAPRDRTSCASVTASSGIGKVVYDFMPAGFRLGDAALGAGTISSARPVMAQA